MERMLKIFSILFKEHNPIRTDVKYQLDIF